MIQFRRRLRQQHEPWVSKVRVLGLTILLLIVTPGGLSAQIRVVDGDTFETAAERVRLFGIDAPERDEPGGSEAAAALGRLVGNADPICREVDRDRYGRMVALCSVGTIDLSLAMIRAGHAVAWCSYLRRQRPALLERFQRAEAEAREARRGMWRSQFTPWRDWGCLAS